MVDFYTMRLKHLIIARTIQHRGKVLLMALLFLGLGVAIGWAQTQTPSDRVQIPSYQPQTSSSKQAQTPSYKLGASGHFGWIARYGLGEGRGLAQIGYAHGLTLSQALSLNLDAAVGVHWPVEGLLSLKATLDNQKGDNQQSFRMGLTSEALVASFGDFQMAPPGSLFASPDRQLKGFQIDGHPNDRLKISGVLSRVEGLFQTRTFHGNTAHATMTFSFTQPDRPWLDQAYSLSLQGLEYYPLGVHFVQGFTQVKLDFALTGALKALLASYDLGYLQDAIAQDSAQPLDASAYLVVFSEKSYYLILREETLDLLRDRVQHYIDEYNQSQRKSGKEAEAYPFNQGTDYEAQFLQALSRLVTLDVDGLKLALTPAGPEGLQGYQRQRFYALGQVKLAEASVAVAVKRGSAERFTEVSDPAMRDYHYRVFPDEGALELDFPSAFFADRQNVLRVGYDYQATQGTYILGLSVLKGSEKVYLNEKLLQAGTDYQINYDTGLLLLLKPIKPSDSLRIDYEVARGGLGGFTEYQNIFSALRADYRLLPGLTLDLSLLQARDMGASTLSPADLRTMPNLHTVMGLSSDFKLGTLSGDLALGYAINRFPFDDNQRQNRPNKINVVRALQISGRALILFGEENGLVLFEAQTKRWSHYGVGEGLAGPEVADMAYSPTAHLLIFATNGGISVLRLAGDRPPVASFAVANNWKRYAKEDGLPAGAIHAALISDDTLWLGSDEGLSRVALGRLDHPGDWKSLRYAQHPQLLSDRVLKLIRSGDRLYLGTDKGLAYFDLAQETFQVVPELQGSRINDLALGDAGTLYVASDAGLRSISSVGGGGWLVLGQPITAVVASSGTIWYGTADGLYRLPQSSPEPATAGHAITAIASALSGEIWVGERAGVADNNYELLLWGISADNTRQYPSALTGVDARDEYQFTDISASGHTDYGWLSQLSLSQALGPLQLSATLRGVSPHYLAIGTQQRQDLLRLDLGASYPISPLLSLSADHEESLTGLVQTPIRSISVTDSIQIDWSIGPKLQFLYRVGRVDDDPRQPGFERLETNYSLDLSQSFLQDRLATSVGLALQDHHLLSGPAGPFAYQELQVNGDIVFRVLDGLTLHADLANPLSFGFSGLRGERLLNWGLDWLRPLNFSGLPDLTMSANYTGEQRTVLPYGSGNLAQNGLVRLQLASLQLGELQLIPQGNITLDQATDLSGLGTTRTWGGQGSLQGNWGPWTSQFGYQRSDARNSFNQVEQLNDNFTGSLSFAGLAGLRPGLNYALNLQTLLHPTFGQKQTAQNSLGFTLDWQTQGSPLNLSLSLTRQATAGEREATVDYALQTSWSYQLTPILNPQLDLSADYSLGARDNQPVDLLSGQLNLRMDYPLPGNWGATAQASYFFGLDQISPKGSYQSLALSVQAGLDFKL